MTSMREKIARALAKAHDYQDYDEVGGHPAWRMYEDDADAVLDALMEPTEGMLVACWPLHHPWGQNAPPIPERQSLYDEVEAKVRADWSAMIAAAKEGK